MIATAVTVPLLLIVALLFAGMGGGDDGGPAPSQPAVLPAVSVSPGEATDDATVSTCAQVISALPLALGGLQLRRTVSNPPTSSVVAWGDPAIVLRCGVAKPSNLNPKLADELFAINRALFDRQKTSAGSTWTIVDRKVFVDVFVPAKYTTPPLALIATAVVKVMPTPVCVQDAKLPLAQQCTRRK